MPAIMREPSRIGVLLINLGTPDAPTRKAVRRYLAEFLSDRRVIEISSLIWQPILRGAILPIRPAKTAHAYSMIWNEGSPLATNTRDQAARLGQVFGPEIIVDFAMRYGNPSIRDRLQAMVDQGSERILLAPLYPQYSAATTATALDHAYRALMQMRAEPAIRTLPPYFNHPLYIEALRASVAREMAIIDFEPQVIVASFHGMPARTEDLGDPYRRQCIETVALLSRALGREVELTFQSQFGPATWFGPSTEATLDKLASQGIRRVAVLTPGFSADCIETLEEINMRARATFLAAGGEHFHFIPCLNATEDGIAMLAGLLRVELGGWLSPLIESKRNIAFASLAPVSG